MHFAKPPLTSSTRQHEPFAGIIATVLATDAESVEVRIPAALRTFTEGKSSLSLMGDDVGGTIAELFRCCPGRQDALYNDSGEIRQFVYVFVNDRDIRARNELATPLGAGDTRDSPRNFRGIVAAYALDVLQIACAC